MSRATAELSWELITNEGVLRIVPDESVARDQWGLEAPAASGPGAPDAYAPLDPFADLPDLDLF
jgi:hypothetical protein